MANGAHYPLYGSLDPAKPGELLESGFGNVFPNFIVDVTKDAQGNYQDAIQFQCLERGGVRIFEGINFLSRAPAMSDAELAAMHGRAKAAGMAARALEAEVEAARARAAAAAAVRPTPSPTSPPEASNARCAAGRAAPAGEVRAIRHVRC